MANRKIKGYGWIPDLPDTRDIVFSTPLLREPLPPAIDLRQRFLDCFPDVYDQGQLGSCTANAIACCIEYDLRRQHLPDFVPSRLFIYYNERAMEGTTDTDSGAMIRDGIKSVNQIGFCPESCWPYDIDKFRERPPQQCYEQATKDRVLSYQKIPQSQAQMKACLASGMPFVFGFVCYSSIEDRYVYETGNIPLPQPGEQIIAGHAIVAIGYNDDRQVFLIRNSWGKKWGDGGYGTLPYSYLVDHSLASDFWVIQTVEASQIRAAQEADMKRLVLAY